MVVAAQQLPEVRLAGGPRPIEARLGRLTLVYLDANLYLPSLTDLLLLGLLEGPRVSQIELAASPIPAQLDLGVFGRPTNILQELRPLTDEISLLLERAAAERRIAASRPTLTRFMDPSETVEEAVVTQVVDLPAEKALAYWDDVAAVVERWRSGLPQADAERALRHIAIDIKWSDAESSSV